MADDVVAQARRLYMHAKNGARIFAMDMAHIVAGLEKMQAEENRLRDAIKLAEEGLREAGAIHAADAMLGVLRRD